MAWNDLFDDPFAFFRSREDAATQATLIDQQNKQAIQQPLSPDDQQSLLQNMLGSGASALSFAGGTLNKLFGGRALRAGLSLVGGGDTSPSELLSFLPGSDLAGLTDEAHQVTGRKLLDQYGFTSPAGEDESFFSPGNLAGLGADIATDPATYLTFGAGAATNAGRAAEKLGILPKTTAARIAGYRTPEAIAAKLGFQTVPEATAFAAQHGIQLPDLLNQPLGGLAGLRVPFTTAAESGTILGTGPAAQKFAETVGKPFQWLANSPAGVYGAALFNPNLRGVTDPELQNQILEKLPFTARRTETFNRGIAETYQNLLGDLGGQLPQEHVAAGRAALEGLPLPATLTPQQVQAYTTAAARAGQLKNQYADLFRQAGGNLGEWESIFDTQHAFRAPTPVDVTSPVWRGGGRRENLARDLYAGVGPAIQRESMFDIPGGTNAVNELVRNPLIGTEARTIGPAGRDLSFLADDAARSGAIEQRLSGAMSNFPASEQETLMALRAKMGTTAGLTNAEQQQYDVLRRMFLKSRSDTRGIIRSDVLGGYNPRELSALRKVAANRGLTAAEEARMDELLQLDVSSRYAAGKVNRLFYGRTPLPGEYADAATQVLPTMKGALQDRAAEYYLRGPSGLGLDPERLADLAKKSGMTPQELAAFAQADSAGRRQMMMQLTSPGQTGRGNLFSQAGQIMTPDEATELLQEAHLNRIAGPLARKLGELNPARQDIGLFNNDPFQDLMNYGRQLIQGTGKAEIVTDLLGRHAFPTGPADTGLGGAADINAGSVLNQLRLDTPQAARLVGEGMRDRGIFGQGVMGLPGDVSKAGIPEKVAASLMQLKPRASIPEYAAGPLGLFDAATQLTRASITAPWPGFHVRNLTTDLANTAQAGGAEALGWGPTAAALARGEAPEALLNLPIVRAAGITDPKKAAELVGREMFANNVGRGFGRLGGDVLNPDENAIMRAIPGMVPQPSFGQVMKGETLPNVPLMDAVNPLKIQGLAGQTETRFAPAVWGRDMAELEDSYARGGAFLHALSQGYAPSAAADFTRNTVYSGAQFTPFEQSVMRRLVPFWGYTKYAVPQQLQFLAEHPGGLAGQGIRAATNARGKGFVPEYLANGLAIPLGGEDDSGTQRYLSGLDMPWESLFRYAQPGQNLNAAVSNTGMNMLSQLNPLLKAGLEGATNKQFLTGRDLDSLYGGVTGVAALDNLVYNSPASRAITSARTLTDPRKYESVGSALGIPLNLLTGAKVTDVDMEKQRGLAELSAVREYLSHDPNAAQHLDFTPRPGQELSPDEVQVFQLLRMLNDANQKAARQRQAVGR